jgi:hypothetical protein
MTNFKYKIKEMSTIASDSGFTSGGEGENHNGPSPRKSTYGAYTQAGFKKVTEGPGATMGPGAPAGPEGVKNNVYVKDFKYKLVKKPIKEAENAEEFVTSLNISDPSRKE